MVDMGCPCCGLTDHGVVAGHLEFDKEFRKRGLKPIFGCELYHGVKFGEKLGAKRDQAHLIALAMTDEGLRNLWRLNDASAQEPKFHHVGRVSWEDIDRYKDGVVFTSACVASLVCQGVLRDDYAALNKYLDIVGDNFYIELSTYPGDAVFHDKDFDEGVSPADLNKALVSIAGERGIPLVYGDDGHYAFKDQWAAHDAYVARSTGDSIFLPPEERKMWHPEGALCIKTEDEVREALSYLPVSAVDEAINNSNEIGERADAHLPEVRRHLPVFIPNESPFVEKGKYEDDQADELFMDLVAEGMVKCYGEDPDERVLAQTAYEAETFLESGLHHYFLLAWDVMRFADQEGIERGPGRGSAAGCIVARELGITDIDPLPYDLIFERFWNPGRAEGFPDIDSDFEKGRRREIKDYLTTRWGHERVRSIGTITRMKPKAVVEALAKTTGITQEEEKKIKGFIDQIPDIEILGVDQIGWSERVDPGKIIYVMHPSPGYENNNVGEQILDWVGTLDEKRQYCVMNFLELCEVLCNRVSNYGVHASGIVISDVDLPDELPCRFAGSADQRIPVTQFPMDDVDKRMFIKLDVLGLRTLDVTSEWKRQMKDKYDIDVDWSQLEWENQPKEMWELMERGFAAGVFQIERGYPKKLGEEFVPESVSDLSIIVALNRPGPIRSGAPDSFIKRRAGLEEVEYDHPFLEDILDETFGWFLYQEQVIRFFSKLGYSQSDADAVRKILGKKQPEKWDALYHGKEEWKGKSYIELCEQNGIDKRHADKIWAKLVDFGKYSFNKAHSVAYGTIGFRTLFAKYNAPAEFYLSCIRHVDKNKKAERMPEFINEAHRFGIQVHGPDAEFSDAVLAVRDGNIFFGFDDVRGVSTIGANYLVELRDEHGVDISSPEALSEALEKLSKEWSAENARRKKAGEPKQEGKSPKQKLNSGHITSLYTAGAWERAEGYQTPMRELQLREKEMLSVILSDNTAEAFASNADVIDQLDDTYDDAKQEYPGHDVRFTLPGVITNIRETKTKKGAKKMGIVSIEYEGDSLEFAVFPNEWNSHGFMWNERTPGIFTIKYSLNKNTGRAGYNFDEGYKLSIG